MHYNNNKLHFVEINNNNNNKNNNNIIIIIIIINREGREFLLELGRRGAVVSGDPRETVSCFNDCQYASSALTPSLIEAPSQRTPRTRKSLHDYITVI